MLIPVCVGAADTLQAGRGDGGGPSVQSRPCHRQMPTQFLLGYVGPHAAIVNNGSYEAQLCRLDHDEPRDREAKRSPCPHHVWYFADEPAGRLALKTGRLLHLRV